MKKVCLWITTVLVLAGLTLGVVLSVGADNTVSGTWGDLTWELNQTTGHLTISGNGEMESISTFGDNTSSWESYKDSIKTVTIEDGVLSIGHRAFLGCENLTNIEIASSVATIRVAAFSDCINLKELNIPNGITSIQDFAFSGCTGLTSVEIPKSVTSLDNIAFLGCTALDTITVEEDNPVYHSNGNCIIETESKVLFIGCKGSIIPSDGSVTSIGERAFEECASLTSIKIPDGIISIGEDAFYGCTSLTNVEISNSVTSIGDSAFEECNSLTHIEIPNSITFIGNRAFSCCSLTNIEIPNSVTSIGDYAFSDCNITDVEIPNSVTSIGESVFEGCVNLIDLTVESGNSKYHSDGNCIIETESKTLITGCNGSIIPSDGSVTSIGNSAFSYCNLTNIEIPNSITSIGNYAFVGCGGLTNIQIPNSVISIGDSAFSYCTGLTHIKISDSATHIGRSAFYYCSNLTNIEIPSSVTSIGDWTFAGCNNLTDVVIQNGVESIKWCAFQNCKRLFNVVLPNSVTSIEGGVFDGCINLKTIIYRGTEAEWNAIDWDYRTGHGKVIFQEDAMATGEWGDLTWELNLETGHMTISGVGSMNDFDWFMNDEGWDRYRFLIKSVTVGEGITSLGVDAFSGCKILTEIQFPSSLTSIGAGAFESCSSLTGFTIPNTVTHLGHGIFAGCDNLTYLAVESGNSKYYSNNNCVIETESKTLVIGAKNGFIPNDGSVTTIGSNAFSRCDGFTTITIPDSITSLGEDAFYGCSLTEIVLPCNVIKVGDWAFSGCRELTNIVFQNAKVTLGEGVFRECTSLHQVVLPNGMTTISEGMFHGCYGLISVEIPDSVKTIEAYAFKGCYNMPSITIPDSVTTIGDYAFYDCHYTFYHVSIGSGVTKIGEWAFASCSLRSISYNGTEEEWNAIEKGEDWDIYTADYTMYFKDSSIISSDWGELNWTLNPVTGQLTISGNGAMDDFDEECENDAWHTYRDLIQTVTIEDGITSIGAYAFYECYRLASINISDSVTEIGMVAFGMCYSLTSIDLPDSISMIGIGTFIECCSLTSIKIPNGVTDIGYYMFSWCISLRSIEIPNSVTSIGEGAFASCDGLMQIIYYGSEDAWNNIIKDKEWNADATNYTVYFHEDCIWGDGVITKQPTHDESGEKFFTCICGKTKTEPIDKLSDHTYGDWMQHNAEQHKKSCVCGDTQYANHVWDDGEVTKQPTHTELGEKTFTCVCGETKIEPVDKLPDHTYGDWTQHNSEQHKKSCECGDIQYADHVWDDGEVTKQPTHTELGEKTFTCVCGETKTEPVDKLPDHTYGDWTQHNAEQHKKSCECGDIQYAVHVYDSENDTVCNDCEYERVIETETTNEPSTETTDAPITDEKMTDNDTSDEKTSEDSGCGSTVTMGAGLIFLLSLGTVGLCFKKKEF